MDWIAPLLIFLCLLQNVETKCAEGWTYFSGSDSCYKVFENLPKTFIQAENFCVEGGGHLASIGSRAEMNFIGNLMAHPNKKLRAHSETPYLGMWKESIDSTWVYTDGSEVKLSVLDWLPGEPTYVVGHMERCILFFTDRLYTDWARSYIPRRIANTWCFKVYTRVLCKNPAKKIVQCENGYKLLRNSNTCAKVTSVTTSNSPTAVSKCGHGWLYFEATKSCYKVYTNVELNFYESEEFCTTVGGHLVSIESRKEYEFIKETIMHPPITGHQDTIFLGLWSPKKHGDWVYTDGTPVNLRNFDWGRSDPNNHDKQQHCTYMVADLSVSWIRNNGYRLGQIIDIECIHRYQRVLCKKPMNICKEGYTNIAGTKICIQDSGQMSNRYHYWELILEEKCASLPKRSYFDRKQLTCYARTETSCYSIQYPVPPSYEPLNTVREIMRKTQVAKNIWEVCSYKPRFSCSTGVLRKNRCIWLTKTEQTFGEAIEECQAQKGTLFVPHNDDDMQLIWEFLRSTPNESGVWLGLLIANDKWITVDGSSVDYLRWKPVIQRTSQPVGTVFIHDKIPSKEGTYSGYMRADDLSNKYLGLCTSFATVNLR